MPVEVVTGPATEPVTLQEAKDHLRVEVSTDDTLIERLITDAREWAERYTRRALVTQTWRLWLGEFPDGDDGDEYLAMRLPGGKVQSVSSVKYTDTAGTLQTLDAAKYSLSSRGPDAIAGLRPSYGNTWPATRDEPDSVQIEYVVGYGAAAVVPSQIKQAILLHVGWHYEHREPNTFGAIPAGAFDQVRAALELKLVDLRQFTFG